LKNGGQKSMLYRKTIIKLHVSVKHNNILLYWRQVSVIRPSSGHFYMNFKTGYM